MRGADESHLEAIEISGAAVEFLRSTYPELSDIRILNAPVVVFTMAVLDHVHADSEWIFRELPRD